MELSPGSSGRSRSSRSAVLQNRPEYERLGSWLRKIREASGMQQKPLSRLIGKPDQFINKVEHGRQRIDVVEFLDVLRALQFSGEQPIADLYEAIERS